VVGHGAVHLRMRRAARNRRRLSEARPFVHTHLRFPTAALLAFIRGLSPTSGLRPATSFASAFRGNQAHYTVPKLDGAIMDAQQNMSLTFLVSETESAP